MLRRRYALFNGTEEEIMFVRISNSPREYVALLIDFLPKGKCFSGGTR